MIKIHEYVPRDFQKFIKNQRDKEKDSILGFLRISQK